MTGWLWSLVIILGPILLLGAIVWAWSRNRAAGPRNRARSEQGARDLYEEIDEDVRREG